MTDFTEYYESLIDLFASPGWDTFVEDMKAGADMLSLESLSTTDDFLKAKGASEVYNRMLGYEEFIRQGFAEYEDAKNL